MYTAIYRVSKEKDYEFSFRKCTLFLAGGFWFMRQECAKNDYVFPVSTTGLNEELDHMTETYDAESAAAKLCEHLGYELIGVIKNG